jgi:hypothetical protein
MIYLSYFAMLRNHRNEIPNPLSIAIYAPKKFHGGSLPLLAPDRDLLRKWHDGDINQQEFKVRYLKGLVDKEINAAVLVRMIPDNSTLVCWEDPSKFCHRKILGDLLQSQKIQVKEWSPNRHFIPGTLFKRL